MSSIARGRPSEQALIIYERRVQGGNPKRNFGAGETLIAQESTTGMLFFLIDGEVEVYKDEVPIAMTSEPGTVFEMSALLGTSHRASVRTVIPSSFYVMEDGRHFLEIMPL